jgi:hypothetical protein
VVDGSGNVTGVSAGTVTISYLLSNGCGSSVATHMVTVYAPAAPISGIDSVGVGHTRELFDAIPGGTWSIDTTGSIAIMDSAGFFRGLIPGSTTVTYTVTNLCGTSSVSTTLYVGNAPSAGLITGFDTVCAGSTTALSNTAAPGGVWTSSSDTLATIDTNGVVHGIAAGFMIVTYTVTNAFGSNFATRVEYIGQSPVITIVADSVVNLGINNVIKGYPDGGTFTSLYDSLGVFVGASDSGGVYAIGFYIGTNAGTNTIHYHVHTPCGDADKNFTISVHKRLNVNSTSSSDLHLQVYPNPSTGTFTVNFISPTTEPASIVITNIVGEKVKELTISTNEATTIKLDQPAGIYFLSASTAGGKYTAKVTLKD